MSSRIYMICDEDTEGAIPVYTEVRSFHYDRPMYVVRTEVEDDVAELIYTVEEIVADFKNPEQRTRSSEEHITLVRPSSKDSKADYEIKNSIASITVTPPS